jgi:hypothetical protein
MQNRLASSAVSLKATDIPESAPVTLILDDRGRGLTAPEVAARVDRGEQVLSANLLFIDESASKPDKPSGSTRSLFPYIEVF